MDLQIFLILLQDGITTGAIYLLLAVCILLVFSVTRIILVPQGDFVAFGALTMALFDAGQVPGTLWLLDGLALACAAVTSVAAWREGRLAAMPRILVRELSYPVAVTLVALTAPRLGLGGSWLHGLLAVAIIAPLGPLLYRIAYQPLAEASVLVLLILSMAVHFVLMGFGLVFFGPEGSRTEPFSSAIIELGGVPVAGQSIWVVACSGLLVAGLWRFFGHTLYGKALRAAASHRLGARLMGIGAATTGRLSFLLAALIGAFAGILIAPVTTIYYDTGFAIGLKGFVAAIMGGLVSYPLAGAGAVLVGIIEAFGGFWASPYREIIVYTLITPVLFWLSLRDPQEEEEA